MQQYITYKRKKRQGPAPSLTPGKPYPVIEERETPDGQKVLINNDRGVNKWYYRDAFEESAPIPEQSGNTEQLPSNDYKEGYREGFDAGVSFQMNREKNPMDEEAMEIIRKAAEYVKGNPPIDPVQLIAWLQEEGYIGDCDPKDMVQHYLQSKNKTQHG